jgi:hypothetical protein
LKRIALAAAGAAVVGLGLTACSQSASPTAAHTVAPAKHGSVTPAVPVSCSEQYKTWVHDHGKGVIAALNAVSSAGTTGDAHALKVALKRARPAVVSVIHHPLPACADPRGYWDVLLMHVSAAATSGGSRSSVRAAMTDVPKIEHALTAEVRRMAQ